ncbi:hypothetical protein IAF51_15955, partial [Acinetobacter baumannii]|nr:hypothetical protein [Acinetobacter baumannii]
MRIDGLAEVPLWRPSPKQEVNQACEAASQAFKTYRHTSPEQRAVFLENIAD